MSLATMLFACGFGLAGFAALCLAMERHHQAVHPRTPLPPRRRSLLRAGGWLLLALALAGSVARHGWPYGSVLWLGALTAAALLLVCVLLPYRPRRVPTAAAAALLVACLAWSLPLLEGASAVSPEAGRRHAPRRASSPPLAGRSSLLLKTRGLRVTSARRIVLALVLARTGPVTNADVPGLVRASGEHGYPLPASTVYRVLHDLRASGLLARPSPSPSLADTEESPA